MCLTAHHGLAQQKAACRLVSRARLAIAISQIKPAVPSADGRGEIACGIEPLACVGFRLRLVDLGWLVWLAMRRNDPPLLDLVTVAAGA